MQIAGRKHLHVNWCSSQFFAANKKVSFSKRLTVKSVHQVDGLVCKLVRMSRYTNLIVIKLSEKFNSATEISSELLKFKLGP